MKLELSQSLQQQQILAPQMILSMDILLLPVMDLEQRIRQEFAENPALELVERSPQPEARAGADRIQDRSNLAGETFMKLASLESQPSLYFTGSPRRRYASDDSNAKHDALQNTEGQPPGLKDSLIQQVHLRSLSSRVQEAAEMIVNNLDHRGYLVCSEEELRTSMCAEVLPEVFEEALAVVRDLDPPGVGAEDLVQCLLLQLERDKQEYPLEAAIIQEHLHDLGQNKIPKIAKKLGKTIEEINQAVEIITLLDPIPGGRLEPAKTVYVRPDVFVEIDGEEIIVRIDTGNLPALKISDSCRNVLKTARGNSEVTDFVRKKIESAQWLIQAVEQRQKTLQEIAVSVVQYQREFMLRGPERLRAMKMQTIADLVGVHISTISRATKGKYIQTPWGLYEMRYFFTGGVEGDSGEIESRRNVYRRIGEIIEGEDKAHPLSDSQITHILKEQGLKIARRTVTKYREQENIPSSRLRKVYG